MSRIPLIFIIAGEASGDQLGASLMASLRAQQEVRFAGIGGPGMKAQGLTSLFPMEELSIIGVMGILRQLPHLLRRVNETVKTIQDMKPDVVVTIDAQEFSYQVMKRLHKLPDRPRLIHYVAPTVWVWRPGRAKKLAALVDHLLCLYPFEPHYFEKYGLKTTFVGHPVAQERMSKGQRDKDLVCVLPGSRRSEVRALLPIFGQTLSLLHHERPGLKVVIPTLPSLQSLLEDGTRDWPVDVKIVVGDEARREGFQQASVAMAASGTVALQLAAAGLPFIVAYKIGKVQEWIGRMIIKTPWVCMVNILMGFHTFGFDWQKAKVSWIPEFLQDDCTPKNLKEGVIKLLEDPEARRSQEEAMGIAMGMLEAEPHAAARCVLEEARDVGGGGGGG